MVPSDDTCKKTTKIIFGNQLAGRQLMMGNEIPEMAEEYTCLGKTNIADLAHGK